MAGYMEDIRRALVLGLGLIAGTAIEQAPSVVPLQLQCILPFGMLCLSVISMMFIKIMFAVCMLVGMVV